MFLETNELSFLTALCTTMHMTTEKCQKVHYLHDMLWRRGTHVLLGTPGEGTLTNIGTIKMFEHMGLWGL